MKHLKFLSLIVVAALLFTACKNVNYDTTASGLKYKIFDGGGKDSTVVGDVLKMNVSQKISGSKDTLLGDTYGKLPAFVKVQEPQLGQPVYGPDEVFKKLKKGDSLIAVLFVDSLIKKGIMQEAQMPPFMKKGDKLTLTFKVLDVFKNDSLANLDYQKEMEKDAPRQKKEQEAQMEKMRKEMEAKQKEEDVELEKSGEKAKQIKIVEDYLTKNKVAFTKTPLNAFVRMDKVGDGAQVADGKYVTIEYIGKKVADNSTFEGPGDFTVQIGKGMIIRGLEDGLRQFKQGGVGAVYIPGYLAYGKNPQPNSPFKAYEPLFFEVKIKNVSDKEPAPQAPPKPATEKK